MSKHKLTYEVNVYIDDEHFNFQGDEAERWKDYQDLNFEDAVEADLPIDRFEVKFVSRTITED